MTPMVLSVEPSRYLTGEANDLLSRKDSHKVQ